MWVRVEWNQHVGQLNHSWREDAVQINRDNQGRRVADNVTHVSKQHPFGIWFSFACHCAVEAEQHPGNRPGRGR